MAKSKKFAGLKVVEDKDVEAPLPRSRQEYVIRVSDNDKQIGMMRIRKQTLRRVFGIVAVAFTTGLSWIGHHAGFY